MFNTKMLNRFQKAGVIMKKYEYKCVFIGGLGKSTSRRLSEYGREGWELVCVWWAWHYLKREIRQ